MGQFYTTGHFVAKAGHEEALREGYRRFHEAVAPGGAVALSGIVAAYAASDVQRPGYVVTFGIWPDRGAFAAIMQRPEVRQLLEALVIPHIDPERSMAPLELEEVACTTY